MVQDDHKHARPQVTVGIPALGDLSSQSRQVLLPIDLLLRIALLWLVQLLTCITSQPAYRWAGRERRDLLLVNIATAKAGISVQVLGLV